MKTIAKMTFALVLVFVIIYGYGSLMHGTFNLQQWRADHAEILGLFGIMLSVPAVLFTWLDNTRVSKK